MYSDQNVREEKRSRGSKKKKGSSRYKFSMSPGRMPRVHKYSTYI